MILTELNTKFTKEGSISKEALLAGDIAIIYKSTSLITSKSYSGNATKITKSSSISEEFTDILQNINGYVSLGMTKTSQSDSDKGSKVTNGFEYKNAHIYSSKATTLDGSERICYIYGIDSNTIGINECSSNKGASYSSLYLILKDELLKNDFKQRFPSGSFIVTLENAQKIVDIINDIIEKHEQSKYKLIKENNRLDTITFGKGEKQKRLYYSVAYWREVSQDSLNIIEEDLVVDLNNLVNKIEAVNTLEEIEVVIKKLDELMKLSEAKKTIISIKENI